MFRLFLPIFFFSFFTFSFTQQNSGTDFQIALNSYVTGGYNDALKSFRQISAAGDASYSSLALLFTGKTEMKLSRYAEAEKTLISFLQKYPDSRYRDEARAVLAKVYLEKRETESALKQFLYLIDETDSKEYKHTAKENAAKIASLEFTPVELEKILLSVPGSKSRSFLLLETGKSYLRKNNRLEADAAFLEIIENYPKSDEKEEAVEFYNKKRNEIQILSNSDSDPVVAVLLPLTIDGSAEGTASINEILEGIKFAVSEHNRVNKKKIGLLIRNTDNSPANIEELSKELDRILSLKVIIGPVFSDEVSAALRVFKNKNIPIISPTATENDLTDINEFFFQANPSFAMRGKAMAQYLFFVENKRKIGVINANQGYSPALSLAFTSEFERLGGEITVRETYTSGSFELQDQARRISGYTDILEGLYIPLSDKADANAIVNELLMNNVNIPIYGNQDWFYSKVYSGTGGLTEQLTFTSDHFIDFNSSEYQEFSKEFNLLTTIDANRNVLYGYDAAKFILETVSDWSNTPIQIKREFESGRKTEGFHNYIGFDNRRVNNYLNIVRYSEGIFNLIEIFKTGTR